MKTNQNQADANNNNNDENDKGEEKHMMFVYPVRSNNDLLWGR
jgi:hypothetical protein